MGSLLSGISVAFGLGFFYFLGAIPSGVAAGLPVAMAGVMAWVGYSCGAVVLVAAGTPAREWVVKKLGVSIVHDPAKWIWRAWDRAGLAGLALIAPVTVGPQIGAVISLVMGEPAWRVVLFFSLGVIPWCLLFALLTSAGADLVR